MSLTKEQVVEIKKQILEQTKHLPEEKRKQIEEQINRMPSEALEEYVRSSQSQHPSSIFRMIVSKEIESVIVEESPEALAVLEINPLSQGHLLIIPKQKISTPKEMSDGILKLAEKMKDILISKLKAEKVDVKIEEKFGEAIIEVIPHYKGIVLERKKREPSELEEVKKEMNRIVLEKKVEKIGPIKSKKRRAKPIHLNRRVP